MSSSGGADIALARRALLDALDALRDHRGSVVVVGAQAIYMRAGPMQDVALAELTYDGDLAIDPRSLGEAPTLERSMLAAGFRRGTQPGSWISIYDIDVDLMVPGALSGDGGRRGARIPPHSRHAARRTDGLEAALVQHSAILISAFEQGDDRAYLSNVASLAALLVAKVHKLADHLRDGRDVDNKDAHDVYRILRAATTAELASDFVELRADGLAGSSTRSAIGSLSTLFAEGSPPIGADLAGEAEGAVGDRDFVVASVSALAGDLVAAVHEERG